MSHFSLRRDLMVRQQIQPWGVSEQSILEVFSTVPREKYLPKEHIERAYDDILLTEKEMSFIQPSLLAKMFQALSLSKNDTLLLVGIGYGYSYAIASELALQVTALEYSQVAFQLACENLSEENYSISDIYCRDGHLGASDLGSFDAIMFTGAFEVFPSDITYSSLNENGRCFFFCQEGSFQQGYLITKKSSEFTKKRIFEGQIPFLQNIPKKATSLLF